MIIIIIIISISIIIGIITIVRIIVFRIIIITPPPMAIRNTFGEPDTQISYFGSTGSAT